MLVGLPCRIQVVINYRDESLKGDAEEVAKEVEAAGGEAFIVQADMTKVSSKW